MVEIFHELDGDLSALNEKTISIIGYGNQGRAQALNLRDSGLNVIIGNKKDEYRNIALNDNFSVFSIAEATEKSVDKHVESDKYVPSSRFLVTQQNSI